VRHDEGRALVALERLAERDDGLEVEVVGGLVEDEHVVLLEHQLGEHQAHRLAAGEVVGGFSPSSPLNNILPSRPRISWLPALGSMSAATR
jgi:hypothetical protein